MLTSQLPFLQLAQQKSAAVGMFNVVDLATLRAVIAAAEAVAAPVVVGISSRLMNAVDFELLAGAMVAAARRATVPVAVELNHAQSMEQVIRAVRAGFTDIMFDASHLPHDENVQLTTEVVAMLRPMGIAVEGEVRPVLRSGEVPTAGEIPLSFPEECAAFVRSTGVDSLAVAIGSVHGMTASAVRPALRLDVLAEIRAVVDTPLVLHGGSGVGDQELARAIAGGICKVDIYTALSQAALRACAAAAAVSEYPGLLRTVEEAVHEEVRQRLRVLNSSHLLCR